MGKPFSSELTKLNETLRWSFEQEISSFSKELLANSSKPLYIVGSGGSLSACVYAASLYQLYGTVAKAVTPFELFSNTESIRGANVLFISASGKNSDIIFAFKTAIAQEPNRVFCICMKQNSPLIKLAGESAISSYLEFELPSGKDGFLATNSLIAFYGILYRVFFKDDISINRLTLKDHEFIQSLNNFLPRINKNFTFSVIYGKYGHSIAIDLESKIAEAALGNVLVTDIRNFGHGRHHWFDKRKINSAIIAVTNSTDKILFDKTLNLLPNDIPILFIDSEEEAYLSCIPILVKSFYFIEALGKMQGIDPGRPGVPDYGSKLYRLKYETIYKVSKQSKKDILDEAIRRKSGISNLSLLSKHNYEYWNNALKKYIVKLQSVDYGIIVFDYDGTLCTSQNRYYGFDSDISNYLNEILKHNVVIGIATGRGKSVREALQGTILKEHWDKVIIGYYNCSQIAQLSDQSFPTLNISKDESLIKVFNELNKYEFPIDVKIEQRPDQISVEVKESLYWTQIKNVVIQITNNLNINGITILESSHSLDIINHAKTSKLNIIRRCKELAKSLGKSEEYLTIGDKGQWPGNDFQLLAEPHSLSVDEVSPLTSSCWNLSIPGYKNTGATKFYLSSLSFSTQGFKIKIV